MNKWQYKITCEPPDTAKTKRIENSLNAILGAFRCEQEADRGAGDLYNLTHATTLNLAHYDEFDEYTLLKNPYPQAIDKKFKIDIYLALEPYNLIINEVIK